jgi:hypothetical protein
MSTSLSTARNGAEMDVFAGTNPGQVAKAFKASGMFPDLRDEAQAFVKVMAGRELGIGPMASMMGINMIQGKVTLSANLMASQVKSSQAYDYIVREHTASTCRMDFLQNGEVCGTSEFTMEDAQRAGLVKGGGAWSKYPKAMLFARALSQGVRWYCPDVLNGSPAYVPEEMGAQVNEDGEAVNVTNPEPVHEEPETVEAEVVETLPADRQESITAGLKALGLNIGQIANLFGAAGLDGIRARSKQAVEERIASLTTEEADAFEAEIQRVADNG